MTTQSVNREKKNTDKCLVKYGDLKIEEKEEGCVNLACNGAERLTSRVSHTGL